MEREDVHELAAGYVLDALDPDERRTFEEHLATCETCLEDVASLGRAASALSYAAEGPAPSPELRGRILGAARAEHANVVPLRRRWTATWTASAAAAAALAVGLGVWATLGTGGGSAVAQRVPLQRHAGILAVTSAGDAVLSVQRLDPAPAGKQYEVWVIEQGTTRAAGLFARGGVSVDVKVAHKVVPGATVAVTLEPAGGVSAPTSPVLFQATRPA
jgi:anti-sigma-K factor RskA